MSDKRTLRSFGNSLPCPECGIGKSLTVDSRPTSSGYRRRRECPNGHRYTTDEIARGEKAWIPDYQI